MRNLDNGFLPCAVVNYLFRLTLDFDELLASCF